MPIVEYYTFDINIFHTTSSFIYFVCFIELYWCSYTQSIQFFSLSYIYIYTEDNLVRDWKPKVFVSSSTFWFICGSCVFKLFYEKEHNNKMFLFCLAYNKIDVTNLNNWLKSILKNKSETRSYDIQLWKP